MEKFKIENFEKEKGRPFPKIVAFKGKQELLAILSGIFKDANVNSLKPRQMFIDLSKCLDYKDINDDAKDIRPLLLRFGFNREGNIYLVWDKNHIDELAISDLIEYWEYIWYPAGDEAVILYCKVSHKILLITDHGRVYFN